MREVRACVCLAQSVREVRACVRCMREVRACARVRVRACVCARVCRWEFVSRLLAELRISARTPMHK